MTAHYQYLLKSPFCRQIIGLKVQLITTAFPQILPAILGLGGSKPDTSSSDSTPFLGASRSSATAADDDEFSDDDGLEFSSDVA